MKKKRTARIREVVVGDDKMLGVVGTNEGKKQIENQKKTYRAHVGGRGRRWQDTGGGGNHQRGKTMIEMEKNVPRECGRSWWVMTRC